MFADCTDRFAGKPRSNNIWSIPGWAGQTTGIKKPDSNIGPGLARQADNSFTLSVQRRKASVFTHHFHQGRPEMMRGGLNVDPFGAIVAAKGKFFSEYLLASSHSQADRSWTAFLQ